MSRKIGILTPFLWTSPSGVNRQVASLASELTAGGHRVTVIAPSADRELVAGARRRVEAVLIGERAAIFGDDEPYPRYFFAGATYAVRERRSPKLIAAPAGLIANIDVLLETEDLDLLHLHEPFVPGLGWAALRHASCPLVATFHANPERLAPLLSTRPQLRRLFDSLDVAIASSYAVRDVAALALPGAYRVIPPGVDLERFRPGDGRAPGPVRLVFDGAELRNCGLGVLLRALRRLEDLASAFTVDVYGPPALERRYARLVSPAFSGRVVFHGTVPASAWPEILRGADVVCALSPGPATVATTLLEAMASGATVVASALPVHGEIVRDGVDGVLVRSRAPRELAAALRRLAEERGLRERLALEGLRSVRRYDWKRVAGEISDVYDAVTARRRQPLPRRSGRRRELFADFHIHSHHSKDCVMPVADILERAREVGLDVVAITDHNSVEGGLEARELADRFGLRVIVGEEVKTSEGEVIGLFLQRTIPGGMSFAETIAAIKEQGGIVYVPHPFDRLHTIPSPQVLRANVADIDVIEVFNSRLAFPRFNELAERFAHRYRIPAAAGSDAHVLPGIGTAFCGIDDFEGPGDFVDALAESRIVRCPRSRLYLQSLKLIQTTMAGAHAEEQGGRSA